MSAPIPDTDGTGPDAYQEMVELWGVMSQRDRRRVRDFLLGWEAAMSDVAEYAQRAGGAS